MAEQGQGQQGRLGRGQQERSGGSSCCALRGRGSRPCPCLGSPTDSLAEPAAFIAARRVKPALKAVSQKGETESRLAAQAAGLGLVPEPLSSPLALVTSLHAGKGKLRGRCFTWAGLLSPAGDTLAQTPCQQLGSPTDPATPSTPRGVRGQGSSCVTLAEGWAALRAGSQTAGSGPAALGAIEGLVATSGQARPPRSAGIRISVPSWQHLLPMPTAPGDGPGPVSPLPSASRQGERGTGGSLPGTGQSPGTDSDTTEATVMPAVPANHVPES